MFLAGYQRLEQTMRQILPFVITVLLALLAAVPWPLPQLNAVTPPLALISVYYWSIHRPDLFGGISAFLIGLMVDALTGMPFGVHAFCFVGIHALCQRQRHLFVNHSFFILWFGFVIAIAAVALVQWLMVSVLGGQLLPIGAVLVQSLLAVLLFPLPTVMLIALQRHALSSLA